VIKQRTKNYVKNTLRFTLLLCAFAGYLLVSRKGAKQQRKTYASFAESLFLT
jgi:hypothetical protein